MAGGRPAGSKDVAPKVRGAFKRALLSLEAKGKPLSGMIEQALQDDFLNTLRTIAAFTPKEIEGTIEVNRADAAELTTAELLNIAATGSNRDTETPSGAVEPTSVH